MESLEMIRQQLLEGEFEFSRHAFRRAVERNISELEIRQAGAFAEIIEDYPDDKYSPSCLLLGFTTEGRPVHLQVSYIAGFSDLFVRLVFMRFFRLPHMKVHVTQGLQSLQSASNASD